VKRRKPTNQRYARIRTTALISGDRDVVELRSPVSTAQTTVISPELAEQIGSHGRPGPVRCTRSAMGEYCGPTRPVAIVVGDKGPDRCRELMLQRFYVGFGELWPSTLHRPGSCHARQVLATRLRSSTCNAYTSSPSIRLHARSLCHIDLPLSTNQRRTQRFECVLLLCDLGCVCRRVCF